LRTPGALVLALLFSGLLACTERERGGSVPVVAVSVPPQRWFVERLAEGSVRVEVMLASGASETRFEPALAQIQAVAGASLYFRVGHPRFPFERTWLEALLAGRPGIPVIGIASGGEVGEDPHLWLSPRRMRASLPGLSDALRALVPEEAGQIDSRLAALDALLAELDAELRARFDSVRGHRFFVLHPAWGSLAEDYGLVQRAIEGEGKEPSVAELERRIEEARAARARVIFVQPQIDPAAARLVAEAVGARVELLDPLAEDWALNLRAMSLRIAEALVP
jgi:zinc transport system substrate-binding protein